MFKTLFAVLAAVCIVLFVVMAIGLATFLDPLLALKIALATTLILAALYYGRRYLVVGLAIAAAASLGGCSTLGGLTSGGATAGANDFATAVGNLNQQLIQNCSGTVTLDWHPPLPPAGGVNFTCTKPQPTMVPLSQVGSLLAQPGAPAPATTGSFGGATAAPPAGPSFD